MGKFDYFLVLLDRIESLEKQTQILDGIASPWGPAAAEMKSGQPDGKKLDSAFDTIEKETEIALISTSTPKVDYFYNKLDFYN